MDEIVIRNSKGMAGCGLLIFLPLSLVGIFTIYKENSLISWLIFLFFASLCAVCLWLYFDRRPRLVINQEGINDRRSKMGVIKWQDINKLSVVKANNTQFIQLGVSEPAKYLSRIGGVQKLGSKLDRAVGLGELSINVTGLEMPADKIATLISELAAQTQNINFGKIN